MKSLVISAFAVTFTSLISIHVNANPSGVDDCSYINKDYLPNEYAACMYELKAKSKASAEPEATVSDNAKKSVPSPIKLKLECTDKRYEGANCDELTAEAKAGIKAREAEDKEMKERHAREKKEAEDIEAEAAQRVKDDAERARMKCKGEDCTKSK